MIQRRLAVLALTFTLAPATSFAAGNSFACEHLFVPTPILIENAAVKDQVKKKDYASPAVDAYKQVQALIAKHPKVAKQADLIEAIYAVLSDETLPNFHEMISKLATQLSESPTGQKSSAYLAELQTLLQTELEKAMPADQAATRATLIASPEINKDMLLHALGKVSQKENLELLIGSGGIHNISPDSLVGRYLQEAAAIKGKAPSTLVDTFSRGPRMKARGGEKLFISVDHETQPLIEKIFAKNPNLLFHDHDTGQGTLSLQHAGWRVSYAKRDWERGIYHETGKVVPVVVLSSIEGNNATNYFTLGTLENKYAKYPGSLATSDKKRKTDYSNKPEEELPKRNYCATGGYSSCTHWVGEMPIGEKFVGTYSMPGAVGDDPYSTPAADVPKGLQTKPVGTYTGFYTPSSGEYLNIGAKKRIDRLTRIVWTQGAGREQFWSMIGDVGAQALAAGEFANPGWVVYNLMGNSLQERVPIVFVFRDDATRKLSRRSLDGLKQYISPE